MSPVGESHVIAEAEIHRAETLAPTGIGFVLDAFSHEIRRRRRPRA
jgi:hypothetical protein